VPTARSGLGCQTDTHALIEQDETNPVSTGKVLAMNHDMKYRLSSETENDED
jgi:hypothetical protein